MNPIVDLRMAAAYLDLAAASIRQAVDELAARGAKAEIIALPSPCALDNETLGIYPLPNNNNKPDNSTHGP